jgi:hypothetical protein
MTGIHREESPQKRGTVLYDGIHMRDEAFVNII